MSLFKKNTKKGVRRSKRLPEVVVATKTIVPAKETLFPGKLKKVNKILSKSTLSSSR